MPAHDIYHEVVKTALQKDGWVITHDPFLMQYGSRKLYADLGAQKLLAATRAERKIVVEVKSFVRPSEVEDLREALGSFYLYAQVLAVAWPAWELYLAIPTEAYEGIFSEPLGHLLLDQAALRLLVFDEEQETIQQWIP